MSTSASQRRDPQTLGDVTDEARANLDELARYVFRDRHRTRGRSLERALAALEEAYQAHKERS